MKNKFLFLLGVIALQTSVRNPETGIAQGLHFSQYYNAPLLLNPANTALLPDNDYRIGANYRKQWSSLPVPYNTFSLYGDAVVARNAEETSWLGLGAALFTDRAGDGNLALTRGELFAAYHLRIGEYNMLSLGLAGASVSRRIDFAKLTWDAQWDGETFNPTFPNGELPGLRKTSYFDVSAGVNYAFFPNEYFYLKIAAGATHLNQPKESFYNMVNQMGIRPTANIDVQYKAGAALIINPSVYYTRQRSASQVVYGSMFDFFLASGESGTTRLLLGAYHRLGDAVIGMAGIDIAGMRVTASYDATISDLGKYNGGNGAIELSFSYTGKYGDNGSRKTWNCPRF